MSTEVMLAAVRLALHVASTAACPAAVAAGLHAAMAFMVHVYVGCALNTAKLAIQLQQVQQPHYASVRGSLMCCCLLLSLHACRALGWHLLQGKGKADMDAKQWEQDAAEKQQRIAELEAELSKLQQELQQQINSHEVWEQLAGVAALAANCSSFAMLVACCADMQDVGNKKKPSTACLGVQSPAAGMCRQLGAL